MVVTVSDSGVPQLSTNTPFVIAILDENDNTPVFSRQLYVATIPENSQMDSFVVNLDALDDDSGINSELSFSIIDTGLGNTFQVDSTSGIVTLRSSDRLDFEATRTFALQVEVQDMGVPPLSSRALVSFCELYATPHACTAGVKVHCTYMYVYL